ncbi:MAG: hypothetical protein JWR80_9499 [Bradyrhizobium sp.]|nr:hypothetical protein [Bradyrhizobium sp.]
MAAALLYLPFPVAFTSRGVGAPGAVAYLYVTGTTTKTPWYTTSAMSVQQSNPITADGAGRFPITYLNNAVTCRLVINDRLGAQLCDVDPYIPGTAPDAGSLSPYSDAAAASAVASAASATTSTTQAGVSTAQAVISTAQAVIATTQAGIATTQAANAATSATASASSAALSSSSYSAIAAAIAPGSLNNATISTVSRALLAGLSTALPAYLSEAGREGVFVFDASNLSAFVTADTAQGLYVAPSSDTTGASGAWVRKYTGFWDIRWFGALANDSAYAGTDSYAAINAMLATAAVVARARTGDTLFNGMIGCDFPGHYYCSASINSKTQLHWRGLSGGKQGSMNGSRIRFPANSAGIVNNGVNTTGYTTGSVAATTGADGSIYDGLTLWAGTTGTRQAADATKCGLFLRSGATVRNCLAQGFAGHGFMVNASTGGAPYYGNANGWHIYGGGSINNGCSGLHVQGSDVNAGECIGLDTYGNGWWGKFLKPFLGGSTVGGQDAGNGAATYVCYPALGQVYSCIFGQEVAASTTTPGTNSAIWQPMVGTTSGTYTTWTNGMTVVAGGSFYISTGVFTFPYVEGSQGFAQIGTGAIVIGGIIGAADTDYVGPRISMGLSTLRVNSLTSSWAGGAQQVDLMAAAPHFLRFMDITEFPSRMIWGLSGHDIFHYYSSTANLYAQYTGPNTTNQFGTGAAFPYAAYVPNLMIGSSVTNGRRVTNGTVAPTTGAHGRGEIVWNLNMTVGSPIGWACTVAGTPGTWVAMANL